MLCDHLRGLLLRFLFLCFGALQRLARRHVLRLIRGEARLDRGDHQDFIEPIEMRRRLHDHLDESILIRILDDLINGPHRQAAWEYLVPARSQHLLARLNAAVDHQVHNLRLTLCIAAQEYRESVSSPGSRPRRSSGR